MDDELPPPPRSSAQEILDAAKQKFGFDTMYPEGRRKKALIPFVSRWNGPIPAWPDKIAAGVQYEVAEVLRSKAIAILEGNGTKPKEFDWANVPNHPLIAHLEELTVSMGGGKGRKEGQEMSKSNPPQPTPARWSWGRHKQ